MVGCYIDNIYVELGGRVYRQTVDFPMSTIWSPLVDKISFTRMKLILYLYVRGSSRNK